jgi:4-diphosphocytidyl-2-C-methyl-D-erythritol kinase
LLHAQTTGFRVNATVSEKAAAKINLTLRVICRRADEYHELESLVAFAGIADTLSLQPGVEDGLNVTGPFAGKSGSTGDNLVLKALTVLRQHVTGLIAGHFLLEKKIPVAAGLGGGSADAAAALRLIARANGIALDDPRLMVAARAVGADVPVCVDPRPRFMRGVGELLSEPLVLPELPAVLANPGAALATRDVFEKFAGGQSEGSHTTIPRDFDGLIDFLKRNGNDLTAAASACVPAVAEVLSALSGLPGVMLARMSGSGPTCFGLFASRAQADAAARHLELERKNWWVRATVLGSGCGKSES